MRAPPTSPVAGQRTNALDPSGRRRGRQRAVLRGVSPRSAAMSGRGWRRVAAQPAAKRRPTRSPGTAGKRRQCIGADPVEQDRKDRQPVGVPTCPKVPVERRLRLRPNPPRHAVPAGEEDKCPAPVHRRLQPVEPPVARLQLGLVEQDGEPPPRQVVVQPLPPRGHCCCN